MRGRAWLHGLLVGLAALGTAGAVSFLLSFVGAGAGAWPPIAVGSAFIDATPGWLKDFATSTFGTADKTALAVGMAIVLAVVFAAAGRLARRSRPLAQSAIGVIGAIGVIAAITRPGASGLDPVPGVVGTAVGVWLIGGDPLLAPRTDRAAAIELRADPSGAATGTDRVAPTAADPWAGRTRRSVLAAALGALGVLLGLRGGAGAQATTASRAAVVLPPTGALPAPALPPPDVGPGTLTSWVVADSDFYRIDTSLSPPRLTTAGWHLVVTGAVEQEVSIDWVQLLGKPMISAFLTLSCVSNEVGGDLVGNALWQGWPVRDLLALARPKAGSDMVLSRSADGWTAGTPLAALTDGRDALLAIGMNGRPLPVEHGFPARLVVPGLYGYVSATKWVTELKVTTFAQDQGYWTPRGWAALGPVKTASRIEVPRASASVAAGRVVVAGTAWAMHRGIDAVQVQVDGGRWFDAQLAAQPTIDAWRQWVFLWDAPPGRHTLTVRAQDGTGQWQTAAVAPPAPDGATGYHSVQVAVGQ